MHSEWYSLFNSYWWLIFPLGWGMAGMVGAWMRHKRAQQALEVVKSYADQGKEIPPEVLRVLQQPEKSQRSSLEKARSSTLVGFIFAALALGFAVFAAANYVEGDHDISAYLFVLTLMAGFAVAFFVFGYLRSKDGNRPDAP